jgi:hypothetical protein
MQPYSTEPVQLHIMREDSEKWLFRGRYPDSETALLIVDRLVKLDRADPRKPKVTMWRILPLRR